MVALSVSISAITSPARTVSPSAFIHWASLPSVMVGDKAGIRMSIAIGFPLLRRRLRVDQNFSKQLRGIRLRAGLRKIGGIGNDCFDFAVNAFQVFFLNP